MPKAQPFSPSDKSVSPLSPDGSVKGKKLVKSRVKKLITRKVRKVRHDGEIVEDIVTEEIPDTEMSETSSMRSGRSDALDFMSPSPSIASLTSPPELQSPNDSISSHSSLRVYTDTVEGEPEITTDVQETEETLPDGRVIIRKIIKTRQKQTIVKRVVLEGPEPGDEGQMLPPEMKIYTDATEEEPQVETYRQDLEEHHPDGTTSKKEISKTQTHQVRIERAMVEGPYIPQVVKQTGIPLHPQLPAGENEEVFFDAPEVHVPPQLTKMQSVSKPKFRISMESPPSHEEAPVIVQPEVFEEPHENVRTANRNNRGSSRSSDTRNGDENTFSSSNHSSSSQPKQS